MPRSKFLTKLRRRNCETRQEFIAADFIKDAIVTQLQPMFSGKEIIDLDIVGLEDPVNVTMYFKKETKRKK